MSERHSSTPSAERVARDERYRAQPAAGVNPRRVNFYGAFRRGRRKNPTRGILR